jgi:hypothetical protein
MLGAPTATADPHTTMAHEPGFPANYAAARAAFLAAAGAAGARIASLPVAVRGPDGAELAIDTAWLGPAAPARVVLAISGTHGVEGYAGSAVQTHVLQRGIAIAPGTALVLVHAVNPWGYAHLRRVNENNVDLNRNCLLAGERYEGAPDAYRRLDPLLNPPSPPARDGFVWRALPSILRHGFGALRQAVAQGQYEFERGLFYGGRRLEEGPRRLLDWCSERLRAVPACLALDLHTGLGPHGRLTLFADVQTGAAGAGARLAHGDTRLVFAADAPDAGGYRTRGEIAGALRERLPGCAMEYYTAEFGTCGNLRMLAAMRDENRCHHWGPAAPDHPARRALLEAFAPSSPTWRRSVIAGGVAVIAAAVAQDG